MSGAILHSLQYAFMTCTRVIVTLPSTSNLSNIFGSAYGVHVTYAILLLRVDKIRK